MACHAPAVYKSMGVGEYFLTPVSFVPEQIYFLTDGIDIDIEQGERL
jgi:hypothetical protein